MKILLSVFLFCFLLLAAHHGNAVLHKAAHNDSIPAAFKGNFTDDYGIRYRISDTTFEQLPDVKYYILKWDTANRYIITQNSASNPSEKSLYSRIDYMPFTGMEPWHWGFGLTRYDAASAAIAEASPAAGRDNPRKGCNGYPFSRMKRLAP